MRMVPSDDNSGVTSMSFSKSVVNAGTYHRANSAMQASWPTSTLTPW